MRKDKLFLASAILAAELFTACGNSRNSVRAVSPTPIVVPTSSERRLPVEPLYDMRAKIDVHLKANSEKEIWENAEKIAALTYETYCRAFPGCMQPAPRFEFLPLTQFSNRLQANDPTGYRHPDDEVRFMYAEPLRDRRVIFNTDQTRIRQAIQQGAFTNVVGNLPPLFIEQQFATDVKSTKQIALSMPQDGTNLDVVRGFSLEDTRGGNKFPLIDRAAGVLASQEVLRQMGVAPYTLSQGDEVIAAYLQGRMNEAGLTIKDVVGMHRASDLNGLLARIYKGNLSENQRIINAMAEFYSIYGITKP